MRRIPINIYRPDPENPGYLRKVKTRSAESIFRSIKIILRHVDREPGFQGLKKYQFDYLGAMGRFEWSCNYQNLLKEEVNPFEDIKAVICWAAPGSSEGNIVHVDGLKQDGKLATGIAFKYLGNDREFPARIAGLLSRAVVVD